ncbi:hypothetical protein [Rhizobium cremeum]|uniref:hypothetical protein n=1 Tax=Rhizobium cremeum TaxID=2813827 RepID=UPI0039DF3F3E
MTDEITSPTLAGFLDRVGLTAAARERVIAIDRALASELESDHPDTDGCASLVLEAADLIAYGGPLSFDWSGWGDDDPAEYPEEDERDNV